MLSIKIHTLVATWSGNGSKTISGCVAGEPVFLAMGIEASSSYKSAGVLLRVTSGAKAPADTKNSRYYGFLGYTTTASDAAYRCPCWSGIIVPTATSVVVSVTDLDSDERVYIYR